VRRGRQGAVGAIVVVALMSVATACTLITNLNGLTGGGGGSPEASTPEDGSADANGITPQGDGGGPDDATVVGEDAGSPEGSTPPFCASQSPVPTFCDDFDEDPEDAAALAAPWDQVTGMGGSVQRAGQIFTSSPYAMLAMADSPVTGNIDLAGYKAFTNLSKAGEYTAGTFTLAFDLYVVAADTTDSSDAVLAAFEMVGTVGNERWALQLETSYDASDAGSSLDVSFSQNRTFGDGGNTYSPGPAVTLSLPLATWTRVTMIATTTDVGAASVDLQFDGKEVSKTTTTIPFAGGIPEILVGLTYAAPSSQGWTVRYDDVTFVASP
jgi:hypothetical protein